jgi:hypothetical protein
MGHRISRDGVITPVTSPARARIIKPSKIFPHMARVLKTGQTTQYSSELDDGYYQTGITKDYTVLTAGQYSGTTNVDLIHYAAALSFDAASKEIRDAANGLALFKTGDIIVVTGSASNDGTYTVATGNVAAKIVTTEALADEAAGGAVSIAKREAKSNNCVVDNNTGLMWMRDPSNYPAKMGVASDGKMPWTGVAYDIFAYCAAVNTAAVGGYTDWRGPSRFDYMPLGDMPTSAPATSATAFPNTAAGEIWTSTTLAAATTYAWATDRAFWQQRSPLAIGTKTETAMFVMLVRGGR